MEEHLTYHQRQARDAQKEANKLLEEGRRRRARRRREGETDDDILRRKTERLRTATEIKYLRELHAQGPENLTGDDKWIYNDLIQKYGKDALSEEPLRVLGAVKSDKEKRPGYAEKEIPSWLSEVSNNPPKNNHP